MVEWGRPAVMPYDVFISYARSDNRPEGHPLGGWIKRFHARLLDRLVAVTGRNVSVFFDEEDRAEGEPLSDIIRGAVAQSRVLLCVLSPAFPERIWCRDEVLAYLTARRPPSVVLVAKLPPPNLLGLAEPIRTLEPKPFWHRSGANPIELAESSEAYREAINDVAHTIHALLPVQGNGATQRPSIYVTRGAPDLAAARLDLERYLMDTGYSVVPSDMLDDAASIVEGKVPPLLTEAALSIHLVGRDPSGAPTGAKASPLDPARFETLTEQQWRLTKAKGRPAIVWFPSGMTPQDPHQIAVVSHIETNPGGAAIVRGNIGDLIQRIRAMLAAPPAAVPPNPARAGPSSNLYVLRAPADDEGFDDLVQYAENRARVLTLPPDGTENEKSVLHDSYLKAADHALLFWGKASQAWIQMKLLEFDMPVMQTRRRGAYLKNPSDRMSRFRFPPYVDVLRTPTDLDRFLGGQ